MILHESVEKGVMGGEGAGRVSEFSRKIMSEYRAQKFCNDDVSLPWVVISDSDGLKPMFNKSEALPKSLFCCKACTGLCASVAGFEATINEFSRLKANLILVLKFQIVT